MYLINFFLSKSIEISKTKLSGSNLKEIEILEESEPQFLSGIIRI